MKRVVAILLAMVMLAMTGSLACADTASATRVYTASSSLSSVKTFKFKHMKKGIKCGKCPVYSAPSYNAYRANNGKAMCNTNYYVDVSGFSTKGWLLVRYQTNDDNWRVGWIPKKYVKGVETGMYLHFSHIKRTATDYITVTENNFDPDDPEGQFAELEPGDTYYILGRYNYYYKKTGVDLWYIQFTWEGKMAMGFIKK